MEATAAETGGRLVTAPNLDLYVITHRTKDYGERFVVRRQLLPVDGSPGLAAAIPLAVVDSLELARAAIPPSHSWRVERVAEDDVVIVESWTASLAYHAAISVDIDRFSDRELERRWAPAFARFGGIGAEGIRALCRAARAGGQVVFAPCDRTAPDGSCLGHVVGLR